MLELLIGTIGKIALNMNNYIYLVKGGTKVMDLLTENSPESCLSLGLDCGTCIHQAATTVAKISCLDHHRVQQIFFMLYPSPACRAMAPAFELAYREASTAHMTLVKFTSAAA